MIVRLYDEKGVAVGTHNTLGVTFPLVLFKGKKTYLPSDEDDTLPAMREVLPGDSIILRYPLLAKA